MDYAVVDGGTSTLGSSNGMDFSLVGQELVAVLYNFVGNLQLVVKH